MTLFVVVVVLVRKRVEVDTSPTSLVTVDWRSTVMVGCAAVLLTVVLGTGEIDLVPINVWQFNDELRAIAEDANSGPIATV